jgi:hypothetical protein
MNSTLSDVESVALKSHSPITGQVYVRDAEYLENKPKVGCPGPSTIVLEEDAAADRHGPDRQRHDGHVWRHVWPSGPEAASARAVDGQVARASMVTSKRAA